MGAKAELLHYLAERRITIQEAIAILATEVSRPKSGKRPKQKAVLRPYETREQ